MPPSINIAQLIDDYVYRYQHKMFPVVEDGRLAGCVEHARHQGNAARTVGLHHRLAIMQPCSATTAIRPDADALEALSVMNRTQNGRLLVIEGDRLVGVVTLKDMLKFLSLKLELEESGEVDLHFTGFRTQGGGLTRSGLGRSGSDRASTDRSPTAATTRRRPLGLRCTS